jgi:hypothetical protein
MSLKISNKLKELHPDLTEFSIKLIINKLLNRISTKSKKEEVYFVVPNLGKFHTHGNAKSKKRKKINKKVLKNVTKIHSFSDSSLLF